MALNDTTSITLIVREAYNMAALQALTENAQFFRSTSVKEVNAPGAKSAVFDVWALPTVATAALGETADGTPVSLSVSQVECTLVEQGDYTQWSGKLSKTSYDDVEEQAATTMGQMAAQTLDILTRAALDTQTGGTWCDYAGAATSVNTITIGDELAASDFRKAFAMLRSRNVKKLDGGYYLCYIHPHVFKDIKDETGDASWTVKELYTGERLQPIMDEVGHFEGFRVVLSTNCLLSSKAGNGTTTSAASADVYTTYFVGADAVGFANNGPVPEIVIGDPVAGPSDPYRRHSTVAWHALCGFTPLRDDALYKAYSSSSLAANGA